MKELALAQQSLNHHPLFDSLTDLVKVRRFMESHVWAVWDFMSLLKRLQTELTCVNVPWRPSPYPATMVRLINQIVLGEESDVDEIGRPISHFALYLAAMEEVGADTTLIRLFLKDLDLNHLPPHARTFTEHTLSIAQEGDLVEVAAAFFYGREKVIPGMFQGIMDTVTQAGISCPKWRYYLERHIHVDAEEHGPLSEQCLLELCAGDESQRLRALAAGLRSLKAREQFWQGTLESLIVK